MMEKFHLWMSTRAQNESRNTDSIRFGFIDDIL